MELTSPSITNGPQSSLFRLWVFIVIVDLAPLFSPSFSNETDPSSRRHHRYPKSNPNVIPPLCGLVKRYSDRKWSVNCPSQGLDTQAHHEEGSQIKQLSRDDACRWESSHLSTQLLDVSPRLTRKISFPRFAHFFFNAQRVQLTKSSSLKASPSPFLSPDNCPDLLKARCVLELKTMI